MQGREERTRRGPLVVPGAGHDLYLWSVLFASRHVVIIGLAVGAAVLPDFGDDRFLIAALLAFVVLPYDLAVHAYARLRHRLPTTMPFVYAPVPALFVIGFPETWIPALLAAIGNVTLFSLTFEPRVAAGSMMVTVAGFAVAVAVARPEMAALGFLGFVLVAPSIVIGVGALVEAYRLNRERYRDHVENAQDVIYTHDLDSFMFIEANDAALRLTGYTREELGTITVADVVAPEHLEEVTDRIARAITSDRDPTPWEIEVVTKDGRRVPLEVNTRVVRRRGQPVAIQGIARDVSERKQVEEQRGALDRARTEFIANAAHELRTPLTTLAGLASLLTSARSDLDSDEVETALEALTRQGRRARVLADRLLDLSSIELGRIRVQVETVDVRDTVQRVLEEATPPDGVEVSLVVDGDLRVVADRLHVEQVLRNLLVNAYRYGGPHVEVSAERIDGTTMIRVADDGPGVAGDLVPRLFEPFTRGDHEQPAESTGLGLAICARLMEAMGGTITYESRQPRGSCFRVDIPDPVPGENGRRGSAPEATAGSGPDDATRPTTTS